MRESSPDNEVSGRFYAKGASWSEAEERRLYEAVLNGNPIKRIAASHGRTVGAIRARLSRLGLLDSNKRLLEPLPPFAPSAKRRSRPSQAAATEPNERFRVLLGRLSPEGLRVAEAVVRGLILAEAEI